MTTGETDITGFELSFLVEDFRGGQKVKTSLSTLP